MLAANSHHLCLQLHQTEINIVNNNVGNLLLFTFDQNLLVHHIACEISSMIVYLPDGELDVAWRFDSRHRHIKLTMGEAHVVEPNTNLLQGLTLRLVDCHGKSNMNWKLPSIPLKWELSFFWLQRYSWNQD